MSDTNSMTVTVNDRRADDAAWGRPGNFSPYLRAVTISTSCPKCGERRGMPGYRQFCEDGEYYNVHTWTNPCGHIDKYSDVLVEARIYEPAE